MQHGLIHGDFNEFNLMVDEDLKLYTIDFPQMVSSSHPDARFYFERDQTCILTLFKRKFDFVCDRKYDINEIEVLKRLDAVVKASGFDKTTAKDDLEAYLADARKQNNDEGQINENMEEIDDEEDEGDEVIGEDGSEGDEEGYDGEEEEEGSGGELIDKKQAIREEAMEEPKQASEEVADFNNEFEAELKAMNIDPAEEKLDESSFA